jgi:hypothetical protein
LSEIRATTISDAAGTGPATLTGQYAAKAWVNFNGTGTVAIRESGNVSSITDENTGDYTVSFTTAMTDVNYCTNTTPDSASKTQAAKCPTIYSLGTTSSIRVSFYNAAADAYQDAAVVNVSIFR